MNSRRSYFDSINAGRRRRPTTSLDQLNQTLDELEGRIDHVQSSRREHAGTRDHEWRRDDASARDDRHAIRRPLARDPEGQRAPEEDQRSIGRIAGELTSLREELRQQVGGDLRHEISSLRREVEQAFHAVQPSAQVGELAAEFERLAAMIHKMSMRGEDRHVDLLRGEMEEVKSALGKLAREDTVRSVDRRWDEFDRRWEDFANRVGETVRQRHPDPAIDTLHARLEQIGEAVNALPTSVTMRSLEDKLKVLSLAVDQFAHQQDRIGPEALDAIEFRLDEISRAVAVAAAPPPPPPFDPEAIDRIEARISALARQIGELAEDGPARGLAEQMTALGRKVEELGARAELPRQGVERLGEQIAGIGRRLDAVPAVPDIGGLMDDMQGRFAQLSEMLDRRHGDSMDQGHALYRELERRLEEVARGLDRRIETLPAIGRDIVGALDTRFAELAKRLESRPQPPAVMGPDVLKAMDSRFADLAGRIEARPMPVSGVDPEILETLDTRLAELSSRIDSRGEAERTIAPRLLDEMDARFADLAGRIDARAESRAHDPRPDLMEALDARLADLAGRIDARPAAAIGAEVARSVDSRLAEFAGRLAASTSHQTGLGPQLLDAIDTRFDRLAERLAAPPRADEGAMRSIAARLDEISTRMEESARKPAGGESDLIRSLEKQVAALSAHISRPVAPSATFDEIAPRLDDIERRILEGRQDVVEAARQAAEDAVRSFAGHSGDKLMVAALVDDLKSLEDLTRRSDDRNSRTFEAIHDTLLKIVDRLGTMEAQGRTDGEARDARFLADEGVERPSPPVAAAPVARPTPEEARAPTQAPTPAAIPAPAPREQTEPNPGESRADARARKLGLKGTPSIDPPMEALARDVEPTVIEDDHETAVSVRTPAAAAKQAAADAVKDEEVSPAIKGAGRMSILGNLSRVLTARKSPDKVLAGDPKPPRQPQPAMPEVDLDRPLDPKFANQPIEPGAGAPDLNAIMRRVRDERGQGARAADPDSAKSDFIAAARRAAQAAAAEAEIMKRGPVKKASENRFAIGKLLKGRSKPVMLGIAAVLIAIAGLQIGRQLLSTGEPVAMETPAVQAEEIPVDNAQVRMVTPADNAQAHLLAPVADASRAPARLEPSAARQNVSANRIMPPDEHEGTDEWLMEADDGAAPVTYGSASDAARDAAETSANLAVIDVPANAGPAALREAAASGDAKALFEIGNRYADGRGMAVDMASAARWYEQAADLGLAPAQYRIGNLFEKGIGVERDVNRAKTWYQLAAAQGNASAMHNLAVLFAMGADGTADNDSAARWFLEAAELGVRDSQFNLGILAARGVGMPQNLIEAYKWFALVAQGGDGDAAEKRDEIARALRPEQLERARAAADLWQAQPIDPDANMVEVPDEWMEAEMPTASVDMKAAIRNIQAILGGLGYDAGAPDGIMGARTKAAISAFQAANGMPTTGEIDEPLVRTLLEKRQALQSN